MPFDVERSGPDSGVMIFALSGTMTMGAQLQQFESVVLELTKNNQNRVVLDMCRISYLDSSAIGVLVGCHSRLLDSGGQLRLAGVSTRVDAIFKMTGVDRVLNLDPTREHSVSAASVGA